MVEDIGDLKQKMGELQVRYSEVVKGNAARDAASSSNSIVQSSQVRTIQVEVGEALEREKRRNNLVIFGIEETNDQQLTKDKVNEIITVVGVDLNKVKYFGRIGRVGTEARTRAVRLVCDDVETRRNVLKGAAKLKLETGYERIYISPDLTKNNKHWIRN